MSDKEQTQAPGAIPDLVQSTLDSLTAHAAVLDDTGQILAVNAAWRRFADANGYAGANYGLGTNYLQVCESAVGADADEARAAVRGLREVMSTRRELFSLEYPCHSLTKRRWFTMRASRFMDGRPFRVLVTHEDITKRRMAEEEVAESYRRLNEAQRLAHIGSWSWDVPANVVTWSDEMYRICGLEPQAMSLSYETFLTFVHADDQPFVRTIIDEAFWKQESFAYDCRVVHPDGTVRTIHTRGASVAGVGMPVKMFGTAQDITERTRAEAALRQQAERLRTLHAIDQAILAAQSSEEIALVALNAIHDLIPYRRGRVIVLDFDAQEAVAIAVRGDLEPAIDVGLRSSFAAHGVTDELIATLKDGEAYLLDLLARAPRTPLAARVLAGGVRYYFCLPLIAQGALIGLLQIGIDNTNMLTGEQAASIREMVAPIAVAIQQARLFEQVRVGRERLQELSRRLVETQETERRQIAQELHDQIGQNLTALSLNLNVLRGLLPDDALPALNDRLDESLRLVDDMVERIRDVMANLRPSVLDDYGLAAALRWYVQQFAERTQIDVVSRIARVEPVPRLPPMVETALFRVAQEALSNIARHANARQVTVLLKTYERATRLSIADNGVGFNPDEPYPPGQRRNLGLIGMRERIETVGGHLRIESAPGQGTRIIAEVPRYRYAD